MKTGLAAQSTAIYSGTQTADTRSSKTDVSEEQAEPVRVTRTSATPNEVSSVSKVDPGRASSPVLNTGKSTSQSSVANSLPKTVDKDVAKEAKPLPWEQQSAGKETDSSTSDTKDTNPQSPLPWQQQSSAKTETTSSEKNDSKDSDQQKVPWAQQTSKQTSTDSVSRGAATRSTTSSSESKIRRVIIDPVTGLYVETSLSSVNNTVSGSSNMSFENRQEDLLEWPFWEMDGRIGLTVAKDSYNGSVAWDQNGEAIDFRFRGPLGIGGLRIHGELDQQVRVKTTTGQDFTVNDFETEMQARMGWSIPINSLRYWALGIVDPEVDADVVLNDMDLLDELIQGDWKVVYERYTEVDGVQLPKKFKITGPDTRIKMLVNDWTIPNAE